MTSTSDPLKFSKYQGLGNDYIVLNAPTDGSDLSIAQVRQICDRHLGVGSDGILCWRPNQDGQGFILRILNPDGSEAEKSGNGLRILARFLWDQGLVADAPFSVLTAGGSVRCQVNDVGGSITVEMGAVTFNSPEIPVTGPEREMLNERLTINGQQIRFSAASVGNPHCVVFDQPVTKETALRLGPLIETHELFPNRINVQFVEVLGDNEIRIEIWERGVGYTLASGTSSCAAAAVCFKLGLVQSPALVRMPGGALEIAIDADYHLTMMGPAEKVFEGQIEI